MAQKYTGQLQSFWSSVPESMKNPREALYLVASGFMVGLLAGCVVALFRIAKDFAFSRVLSWTGAHNSSPLDLACIFSVAIAAGLAVCWLVRNPAIRLGGEDWIKGALDDGQKRPWLRILIPKFLGSWLVLACGVSVGSEGPSIQMGAATALGIKSIYPQATQRRYFILGGCAAGLAAAFSAPFAGLCYVYEVMREKLDYPLFLFMLAGGIGVYFATSCLIDPGEILPLPVMGRPDPALILMLIPLGFMAAITGICYHYILRLSLKAYARQKILPAFLLPCVAFVAAGVMLIVFPASTGEGLSIVPLLEKGHSLLQFLLLFLVVKLFFTAFCYGTGIPAGVMVPVLCLGAVTGAIYASCLMAAGFSSEWLPACLAAGMCGAFAAAERAPVTAIVLVAEMTGAVSILPDRKSVV